jgi:hypothetical protein
VFRTDLIKLYSLSVQKSSASEIFSFIVVLLLAYNGPVFIFVCMVSVFIPRAKHVVIKLECCF